MKRPLPRATQRGRTLIEVMIAITIGMMLSVGILSIYGANRQTYRTSSDLQRMQAAGQLALDRLAYQVRMAGYGRLLDTFTTGARPTTFAGNPVWACGNGFVNPQENAEEPACVNGATPRPDAIQIRYQVDAAAVLGSGENRDCLGFEVPEVGGIRMVQNRFYIADSNGVPTLMCAGNGLAPAPLIPNVEDFQVMLRVGAPFSRAEQLVQPIDVTDWDRVLGVELCVQVRSDETGLVEGGAVQQGVSCRGGAFPPDGRLRRTFTQVVTLRNRIL